MAHSSISVIIPAYNRRDLLPLTLKCLLSQSVPADEIIVVDDGSTDGTAEIAEAFGDPVRVIRQQNKGPGAARNRGFAESKGELIHFFDSDDIAVINKHAIQRDILEETGAEIAYGPWIKGSFEGKYFQPVNQVLQQDGLPKGDMVKSLLCDWSIVPHACLFRRSIIERIGGFPEGIRVGEDQLMFLRCLLEGAKIVHSPGTLELYRIDNTDKLSEAPLYSQHILEGWANFILMAEAECRSHGHEPVHWFGFRKRAWSAAGEIKGSGEPIDRELMERLHAIYGKTPDATYRLVTVLHNKLDGLRKRILGRRGNRSFRIGPLTEIQVEQITASGFELGSS